MALKEFKGRMLPSAPSSTLTVMSSMLLRCGSFICRSVRILVLPSGSVSLLMLATDFDLEMVENDFLRKSVLSWWSWKELAPWKFSLWSPWGSAFLHRGLHFLHGDHLNGLERRLTLCCGHFGHQLASRPGMMWLTFALMSSGCAMGLSVPSFWLLRPTTCTEMIFIATLVTFLAWCRAFSKWVRHSTFATCLTLATLGSMALTFLLMEGSYLIYGGCHCNSSIGLVLVGVLNGCLMLFGVL